MNPYYGYCNVTPWGMIQAYWIVWLVLSFVVSFVLGAATLRNWENVKG